MLKEFYKDQINSPRRLEKIKSIEDLLHVLEIRDVLSEDDVSVLVEIASRLPNKFGELKKKIDDFKISRSQREQTSFNSTNDVSHQFQQQTRVIQVETLNFAWSVSDKKLERMNETIIDEIGKFWKDLARNLKVREHLIDEIDKKFNSTEEKARVVLEHYKSKADPQRWFFNLCEGLERSRRRDLTPKGGPRPALKSKMGQGLDSTVKPELTLKI
ncbi:Fas-associated death domain protein [Eumeta japonica]|uniref:Fas-associated death domain protein n=1 Tax=Eumeta variegata TaxID=151549 RepID=A0A4C1ST27_EUMVA|nr:Fas-associated death domain protein [Eumeta japonica]